MSDDKIEYDEKTHMSYDREIGAGFCGQRGSPDSVNARIYTYQREGLTFNFEINFLDEKKYSRIELQENPMSGMFQFSSSFRKEKKRGLLKNLLKRWVASRAITTSRGSNCWLLRELQEAPPITASIRSCSQTGK
ncbi:MAG: hypothetical protein HQL44_02500 [Alphaproteobacteria bacterium]|nr:hypothetical protein [Alphaproteobacteria bacterium]